MYKIIGADQKEYGPVSGDELRQWIRDGRVGAQTQVEIDGQWKTLSEIPEFAGLLLGQRQAPARSVAAAAPTGGNGMAISSLVIGILSLFTCGLIAPVGLILGIVAMNKSKKNNGTGWGLALAGTIVSGCMLLLIPLYAAMLLPALSKAKTRAQSVNCMNHEKQLSVAMIMYANDNGGRFPPAATWCDAIKTQVGSAPDVFQCVGGDTAQPSHYAFNSRLDGREISKVNPNTVMLFETAGGWNQSGGRELMLTRSRHGNLYVVAFADGHVQTMPAARLGTLRWEP
jgi:prepilin-type processing-associated H-X9-DG protein